MKSGLHARPREHGFAGNARTRTSIGSKLTALAFNSALQVELALNVQLQTLAHGRNRLLQLDCVRHPARVHRRATNSLGRPFADG